MRIVREEKAAVVIDQPGKGFEDVPCLVLLVVGEESDGGNRIVIDGGAGIDVLVSFVILWNLITDYEVSAIWGRTGDTSIGHDLRVDPFQRSLFERLVRFPASR